MKILHTADIHLKEYGDDRWKTLEELIRIGRQEQVAIFVVCGDLFDKDAAAEDLRPKIREVFSGTGFKVVLLAGNHDSESYGSGKYFGEDVFILASLNEPFRYEDVSIWGLPFEAIGAEDVLVRLYSLAGNLAGDKVNILLYHGELLDASFSRKDFGDEGEGRYMPTKLSYFKGLNLSYVLAGHFHTTFDIRKLENGGYFVYPGSPLSLTRRETGQRKVNIFEVGSPPKEYLLDSPHFEEIIVELDPFADENPLDRIQKRLECVHPRGKVLLSVTGYVNSERIGTTEPELAKRIKELATAKRAEELRVEFADISAILEDDLFKQFVSRVEQRNYDEEKRRRLRDLAIRGMAEARG